MNIDLAKAMPRVILQDQATVNGWQGNLILTDEEIRFERPGLPPGYFVVVFEAPLTAVSLVVEGTFRKKLLITDQRNRKSFSVEVRNVKEWLKMVTVVKGG